MTFSFTPKRVFLSLMTAFVVFVLGTELFSSLQESQIQDRLELYQTQLILQAKEWHSPEENGLTQAVQVGLLGQDPLQEVLKQYQKLEVLQNGARGTESPIVVLNSADPLAWSATEIDRLRLEQGILAVLQRNLDPATAREQAFSQWTIVADGNGELQTTAIVLRELWQETPRILPDSEIILKTNLQGWFQYRTLERLYQVQQRPEALAELDHTEQETIEQIVFKLLILTGFPAIGMVLGIAIILTLAIRGGLSAWNDRALAPRTPDVRQRWEVPWTAEVTWQGVIIGFFLIGQILIVRFLIPLIVITIRSVLGGSMLSSVKVQALFVVIVYGCMALGVLLFLYYTLRPYFPLPDSWFQFRLTPQGFGWGIAGYLMALPLVTIVSVLNQQLWQGQGGSNPMLFLALKNNDGFALGCFFFTAAIAAPLFEEWMFRGFLMASLTRYFSHGGAILGSGLIFAVAHLSLSEILPLWVLGSVLGYVYGRSKNLLAPIVLHSLWNSGTLLGLTLLGGQF